MDFTQDLMMAANLPFKVYNQICYYLCEEYILFVCSGFDSLMRSRDSFLGLPELFWKIANRKSDCFRDMKDFNRLTLNTEQKQKLDQVDRESFLTFENVFTVLLDKYNPTRKKNVRTDDKSIFLREWEKP